MATAKKGLGGGLSNLFGTDTSDLSSTGAADSVSQLTLSKIEPNPNQPRKKFDQQALEELAESIRLHGVITPITVRPGDKPGYELLMQRFGLTQEEVARRVVKSRPAVANALRLLALPDEVRTMVADGKLSGGHARAVLSVSEEDKRVEAAKQMVGLSVRQAESLAKRLNKKPAPKPQPEGFSVDYVAEVEKELESVLGRKVSIEQGKNSGTLSLEYYGADDLERLIEALRGLRV